MNASRTGNSVIIYFELPDLRAATSLPHSNHDQKCVPAFRLIPAQFSALKAEGRRAIECLTTMSDGGEPVGTRAK
jgi:hypothetical protein